MGIQRKLAAEFIGTFWLVFAVCGSALLAAGVPNVGIGYMGVAFAVGLSVLSGAYALGAISGAHFNPAVTLGVWAAGRIGPRDSLFYIVAQLLGGIAAAAVGYVIASGAQGFDPGAGFASNGYGDHSPQGYSMMAALVAEFACTFLFVTVILATTSAKAPVGHAPLAIGFALVVVHLIAIPVSNASVNPARSTATAIFQGGWALEQLWAYWVAPIAGGLAAGFFNRWLGSK